RTYALIAVRYIHFRTGKRHRKESPERVTRTLEVLRSSLTHRTCSWCFVAQDFLFSNFGTAARAPLPRCRFVRHVASTSDRFLAVILAAPHFRCGSPGVAVKCAHACGESLLWRCDHDE